MTTPGFANPVTAGGILVQPGIQSPNFSLAGQTGWAILANGNAYFFNITATGTITSTTVVVQGTTGGVFVYSGVPANGNLICSMAGQAGTDAHGNAYPQGFGLTTGQIPGGLINAGSIPASAVSFTARSIGGITTTVAAGAPGGAVAGDLWIDTAAGNALYQYSGSAWVLYQFGTGSIAANSITAAQIAANTITASQIAAGTITASQIAANTITASQLAAGIIYAGIVNGTTITGATIVADGSSGEILVYSGAPVSGNLIASVSPVSGADSHGNSYLAGITSYSSNFFAEMTSAALSFGATATTISPGSVTPGTNTLTLVSETETGVFAQAQLQLVSAVTPLVKTISSWLEVGGPDGNTYDTERLTLTGTGGQTVNSVSYTTIAGLSTHLGLGTYHVRGQLVYLPNQAAGAAEFRFSGGTVVASSVLLSFLEFAGGTPAGVGNGAGLTTLASVFTGSTFGAAQRFAHFDGIIVVSTAGSFIPQVACTVAADTFVVQVGTYLEIFPVVA